MSGMNQEIILSEVDHDNGRMINSGTRELGTHKKDKIGAQHKDGPLVRRIGILGLNLNGETSRLPPRGFRRLKKGMVLICVFASYFRMVFLCSQPVD